MAVAAEILLFLLATTGLCLAQDGPLTIWRRLANFENVVELRPQHLAGRPSDADMQQELDKFFYVNDINDHQWPDASDGSVKDDGPLATLFMISTLKAKFKIAVEGFGNFALSYYDSPEEKLLASGPRVNQTKCEQHLDMMLSHMNASHISRGTNINMIRILDSFGRPEVSTFESYPVWLGNYRQCMTSRLLMDSTKEQVAMQYCHGHFRYPEWPNSSFYERNLVFKTGLCLPETCDSFSGDRYRDKLVQLAAGNFGPRFEGFYMAWLYCLPHRDSRLLDAKRDYLYLSLVATITIWLTVVTTCSLYHFRLIVRNDMRIKEAKKIKLQQEVASLYGQLEGDIRVDQPWEHERPNDNKDNTKLPVEWRLRQQYYERRLKQRYDIKLARRWLEPELVPTFVEIFSLIGNWRKLFAMADPPHIGPPGHQRAFERIAIIDGLKGATMMMVVFGHATMVLVLTTYTILEFKFSLSSMAISDYFIMGPVVMLNCFLVITGLLTSLLVFKRGPRFIMAPTNWLLITVLRYLRVVPLLLLAVWISKATPRHTGHGPLWDYGTANVSIVRKCRQESWWLSLLLLNNFRQVNGQCVAASWYLGVDFQLALVTGPFMMLMAKSARLGYLACALASLSSLPIATAIIYWSNLDKIIYFYKSPYNVSLFDEAHAFYTSPFTRTGPYFVGLILGHVIYRYARGELSLDNWPLVPRPDTHSHQYPQQRRGIGRALISFCKAHSVLVALVTSILTMGSLPCYLFVKVLNLEGSWSQPVQRITLAAYFIVSSYLLTLAISWALFLGAIGYDKQYYFSFFKFRFWRPISRASLSILVFHLMPMIKLTLSNETRFDAASIRIIFLQLIGTAIVCLTCCLLLCLVFEYPLANMVELLVKRHVYVAGQGGQRNKRHYHQDAGANDEAVERLAQPQAHSLSN